MKPRAALRTPNSTTAARVVPEELTDNEEWLDSADIKMSFKISDSTPVPAPEGKYHPVYKAQRQVPVPQKLPVRAVAGAIKAPLQTVICVLVFFS